MGGIEGDGDIFNPKNQAEFVKFVKDNTDGKGVYFVMADGVGVQIVFKVSVGLKNLKICMPQKTYLNVDFILYSYMYIQCGKSSSHSCTY